MLILPPQTAHIFSVLPKLSSTDSFYVRQTLDGTTTRRWRQKTRTNVVLRKTVKLTYHFDNSYPWHCIAPLSLWPCHRLCVDIAAPQGTVFARFFRCETLDQIISVWQDDELAVLAAHITQFLPYWFNSLVSQAMKTLRHIQLLSCESSCSCSLLFAHWSLGYQNGLPSLKKEKLETFMNEGSGGSETP